MSPVAIRWLKFNFVGAIGIGVNMGAFALFYGVLGVPKLAATALAVEIAVLHNFVWHERFTWKSPSTGAALRLLRFHAGNGVVSILGNIALLKLLADGLHLNPYLANALAIAGCAVANFIVSDRFVYRR